MMQGLEKVMKDNFEKNEYIKYSDSVCLIKAPNYNCLNGKAITVAISEDKDGVYFTDLSSIAEILNEEKLEFKINSTIKYVLEKFKAVYESGELKLYIDSDDTMFVRSMDNFIQASSIIYFLYSSKL